MALVLALLGACDAGPPDSAVERPDLGPANWTFVLDAGAFPPGPWPSVVVHAPAGFRVEKPVRVVIWLRGLWNCAANVVRDENGECTPDGGLREAFQLAAQFDDSRRNALLVVPEMLFDSSLDDPGTLGERGGVRALLAETLADLTPALGPISVDDLAPLIVAAHSAAWRASSAIVLAGDLPIAEVWELDALYDGIPAFVGWIQMDLPDFIGVPPVRRFVDIYTGETDANSVNMAETAEIDWLPDAGAVLDDRGTGDIADGELIRGLVFKRSDLSHLDVARVWFRRLLTTSGLPPR